MTDDERIEGLIRRAGGRAGPGPDFAAITRRSRRRRATRVATSVVAVVALAVAGVLSVDAISTPRTVRFAQTGRVSAAPSPARTEAPASAAVASDSPSPAARERRETVDEVPEGSLVAVPDGFVIVSGNVPAAVWFSRDARVWTRQEADGLSSDVPNDVAATPDGALAVLDVAATLWTSDDLGRSWRRVDVPSAVSDAGPTAVAGDGAWWLLGGSRAGEAFLMAVSRDAPAQYRQIDGDFSHGQDLLIPDIAAANTGTVMIADGPQPAVWRIAGDRRVTRVDAAFDDARVVRVTANGDGFIASVLDDRDGDRPSLALWTSSDGVTWSRADEAVPAPTCAQIAATGGVLLAAGRPCDVDAGWEAWLRGEDSRWEQIE